MSQLDARESGQMGLLTVGYYAITTILSIIVKFFFNLINNFFKLGITLVLIIHPGDPTIKSDVLYNPVEHEPISPLDTFLDVVRWEKFMFLKVLEICFPKMLFKLPFNVFKQNIC